MEYLVVTWEHNFSDEPNILYIELNHSRFQERVLEIFADGTVAFATLEDEYNTFLATEPYPELDEVNSCEEFSAKYITKEEFENLWLDKAKKPPTLSGAE